MPTSPATARNRSRAGRALRRRHNWVQLAKFSAVGASGHVGWQGLRFLIGARGAYAANLAILAVFVESGTDKILAQAIAVVLVTPLNFIGNKLWSFRR